MLQRVKKDTMTRTQRKYIHWTVLAVGLLFVAAGFPGPVRAQSSLRIVGALSNFDCYDDTDYDCEGFEIEIEDSQPSDVSYAWPYSAFGAPTITAVFGADGLPATLVRYDSQTAVVHKGGVTHFGVTLASFAPSGNVLRRWLPKATVTVPNPVPVPISLPAHTSQVVSTGGVFSIRDGITNSNPDGGDSFWIEPFTNIVKKRAVALSELMTDDPIVTGSQSLGLELLDPQNTWSNDDVAGSDDTDSMIFSYKVYADVVTYDANGNAVHKRGGLIAVVMDATVTSSSAVHISSLTLSESSVYGPQSVTGTVTLNGPAGASGAVITLTSSTPNAAPPTHVTIPANAMSATFIIKTKAVSVLTNASVTASTGTSGFIAASFVINPPDLALLWLAYLSVKGGTTFGGAVYLTSPAPTGGIVVKLSSNSASGKTPATVTVLAGAKSAKFTVTTSKVLVPLNVTITGVAGADTQSATVRLY